MYLCTIPDLVPDFLQLCLYRGIVGALGSELGFKHVVFDPETCTIPGGQNPDDALGRVELQLDVVQ